MRQSEMFFLKEIVQTGVVWRRFGDQGHDILSGISRILQEKLDNYDLPLYDILSPDFDIIDHSFNHALIRTIFEINRKLPV